MAQDKLTALIFPGGEKPTASDRYDYADEVYTLVQNSTDGVLRTTTRSPVVGALQGEAFKHVFDAFAATNSTIKRVTADIAAFEVAPPAAKPTSPPIVPRPAPVPQNSDCAILDDMEASNALMMSNESKWMRLVEECN